MEDRTGKMIREYDLTDVVEISEVNVQGFGKT